MLVVGAVWAGRIIATGGPVEFHRFTATNAVSGITAKPGREVVFGYNLIVNTGDAPVTLTSAAPDGAIDDSVAELIQTYVIDTDEADHDIIGVGYHRREPMMRLAEPLEGYRLAPGQTVSVVLAFRITSTGRQRWPGILVHYTTDAGKQYTLTSTSGIAINPEEE